MSYPGVVAKPLVVGKKDGSITTNRHSLTMDEHKQVIQACVRYKDYVTGKKERAWLVHIHGEWINKVVDSWIREVRLGKALDECVGVKVLPNG